MLFKERHTATVVLTHVALHALPHGEALHEGVHGGREGKTNPSWRGRRRGCCTSMPTSSAAPSSSSPCAAQTTPAPARSPPCWSSRSRDYRTLWPPPINPPTLLKSPCPAQASRAPAHTYTCAANALACAFDQPRSLASGLPRGQELCGALPRHI